MRPDPASARALASSSAVVRASGLSFSSLGSARVAAVSKAYPTAKAPVPPPVSLTASDGAGLGLVSLDAQAVIDGPLGFTELRLVFRNKQDRVREGRFSITLPPGAAISRFGMKVNGRWQEAEVVERRKARRVYEDFLHRRQDPALLEQSAGNHFSARIFPIPANGTKELVVSYSQELAGEQPYRLPLVGWPRMERLSVTSHTATGTSSPRYTTQYAQWLDTEPVEDFVVPAPASIRGLWDGQLVVARVAPALTAEPGHLESLLLLVDTSASRALGYPSQVERLGALVRALRVEHGDGLRLRVAAFDQEVEVIFQGRAGAFGQQELDSLLERRPLGASDLAGALRWGREAGSFERALIITDAVATVGDTDGAALRELAGALAVERLDLLMVGGIRDEALATALVRGTLPHDGLVLDGALPSSVVVDRLAKPTASGITVAVPGARWVWPETLDGVQPGDERVIYAELERPLSTGSLSVRLGGGQGYVAQELTVSLTAARRPLLERAAVMARIARLQATGGTRAEILELSIQHRVLSSETALLVLETEADYAQYGIDRRGLSDILVAGAEGVQLRQRAELVVSDSGNLAGTEAKVEANAESSDSEADTAPVIALEPPAVAQQQETEQGDDMSGTSTEVGGAYGMGAGSAGGIGHGSGGGGGYGAVRAAGPVVGRRARRAPSVAIATATVTGSLDTSIIRRFVRRQLPRIRHCYEQALMRRPELEGTATATFAIAEDGSVVSASVTGLGDDTAEQCISAALRAMKFPKVPGGGAVRVRYPFRFTRGQDADEASPEPAPKPAIAVYTGAMAEVMQLLAAGEAEDAVVRSLRWRREQPSDLLSFVALGQSLQAYGKPELAARAYGSIIDLYPARADMRRFAGQRLEDLGDQALELAMDSYAKAAKQRSDHPGSHRLYAYALVRAGKPAEAFAALEQAFANDRLAGRFSGTARAIGEDLELIGAAWAKQVPEAREQISRRLQLHELTIPASPSTRFVLHWETDANDVDLHIYDQSGGHSYYSEKLLPSGGELYEDITTGYGPEAFVIDGTPTAYPYRISAHYYARGPMGYGMGSVQLLVHDGAGELRIEQRPFVVMNDQAMVELGEVTASPSRHR